MSSTPFNIAANSTSLTPKESTSSTTTSNGVVSISPTTSPTTSVPPSPVILAGAPVTPVISSSLNANSPEVVAAYNALIKLDKLRIDSVWGRITAPNMEPNAAELKIKGFLSLIAWHQSYIKSSTEIPKLPEPEQFTLYNNGNKIRHSGHTVDIKASSSNVNIGGTDVTVRRLGGTIASIKNAWVVIDKTGPINTGFVHLTMPQASYLEFAMANIRYAASTSQIRPGAYDPIAKRTAFGIPKSWNVSRKKPDCIADSAQYFAQLKLGYIPVTIERDQFPKPREGPCRWFKVKIRVNETFSINYNNKIITYSDANMDLWLGSPVILQVPSISITAGTLYDPSKLPPRTGEVAKVIKNKLLGLSCGGFLNGTALAYSAEIGVDAEIDASSPSAF